MVGEVLCPDCGGVVGALETTEAGAPCKCFIPKPKKYEAPAEPSDVVEAVPVAAAAPAISKICRICGTDVSEKKRVKDHLGYYCYDCSKAEEAKLLGGRIRCGSCGHLTKEEALINYEGTRICPRCHRERLDLHKQKIKTIGYKGARTRAELAQIYRMLTLIGGLLLIIVISTLWVMLRHHGR